MPGTGGDGANKPPRTLAEKLSRLREARAPEGGKPPSWDALAKQISDKTGVAVSGAYLWELGTGKPGTNVTLKHLKAFKEFFGRSISYFVDDEVAFEDDEQAQLALLKELSRLGIKQIRLQNMEGDGHGPSRAAADARHPAQHRRPGDCPAGDRLDGQAAGGAHQPHRQALTAGRSPANGWPSRSSGWTR